MRASRLMAILAVLAVTLAACESTSTPGTTPTPLPPPDAGNVTTLVTTAQALSSTTTNDPSPYTYRGFLPDGTHFVARVPGEDAEFLNLVTGDFSYMSDDGPIPVGEVRYLRARPSSFEKGYDLGLLRLQTANWLVEVEFDAVVLEDLGKAAEELAIRSISLEVLEDTPIIRLEGPFSWIGGTPQIRFETFVIATGCWEMAARCTENRALQLLSAPEIFVGTRGLTQEQIDHLNIETTATRPLSDPNYLDPGPLGERFSADVIWTGEEMIVWGGKESREGLASLVDGAAFDPAANRWRMLAKSPIDGSRATRAVWGDEEMIVVSPDGSFGYDPNSDSWRTIGIGVAPSEWPDRMVYVEGKVFIWERTSLISELTVATGQWQPIDVPDPAPEYADPWFSSLTVVGDRLILTSIGGNYCSGKQIWHLDVDGWDSLPEVSLATETYADCSAANQTAAAGGDLVIWDEESHPAKVYSFELGHWRDIPTIPLGGTEGPPGPVEMDDDRFMVPRWGEGAIFDATADTWTQVTLPGAGSDVEIVWTGTEFLAWGVWETIDAWRWAPSADR